MENTRQLVIVTILPNAALTVDRVAVKNEMSSIEYCADRLE
ncbi:MAG: hypothetical protein ACP5US_09825 [Candidatus Kryptoniota bacterium]